MAESANNQHSLSGEQLTSRGRRLVCRSDYRIAASPAERTAARSSRGRKRPAGRPASPAAAESFPSLLAGPLALRQRSLLSGFLWRSRRFSAFEVSFSDKAGSGHRSGPTPSRVVISARELLQSHSNGLLCPAGSHLVEERQFAMERSLF